ncbi:hypothetical protein [Parvibaculum sp.]|uniref:hypothetical protein n=1 Tax=Parvibaculum sp. TaxID=2024848 RepID=UPI0032989EA7
MLVALVTKSGQVFLGHSKNVAQYSIQRRGSKQKRFVLNGVKNAANKAAKKIQDDAKKSGLDIDSTYCFGDTCAEVEAISKAIGVNADLDGSMMYPVMVGLRGDKSKASDFTGKRLNPCDSCKLLLEKYDIGFENIGVR